MRVKGAPTKNVDTKYSSKLCPAHLGTALFTHYMVLHQTALHDFSCFVKRILFNLLCMFSYLR